MLLFFRGTSVWDMLHRLAKSLVSLSCSFLDVKQLIYSPFSCFCPSIYHSSCFLPLLFGQLSSKSLVNSIVWGICSCRTDVSSDNSHNVKGPQSHSYCCCLVTKSCLILCDLMNCSTPDLSVLHYLSDFAQTHVHWVADAIQWSHPLSCPSPPALNLSQNQGLFQWVGSSHQRAKVLKLQLQHQSFNEYSGLISFRIDWSDLAVHGSLKGLLQYHSLKASVLKHSIFFIAQLSHPYTTTGKTIALTRQTFVSKVMSLLLTHCLGFSWLFFPGASIF